MFAIEQLKFFAAFWIYILYLFWVATLMSHLILDFSTFAPMQLDKTLSFDEFEIASLADWKTKATKDLKGIPLEDLAYTTSDGITLEPYFTEENSTS
ncbi:MAG: hypothetical protein ACI8ZQ_001143, partial [Bacteroidia bacterium]